MSIDLLLQTAPAAGSGSLLMTILPFGLIFVIFYFFMIRPQNKKQKETERMIAAIKKGDKVITIGGIHGVVSSTKEKTVVVKVDDDAKIEFNRTAIASVVVDKAEKAEKIEKTSKKDKNASESASTNAAEVTEAEQYNTEYFASKNEDK